MASGVKTRAHMIHLFSGFIDYTGRHTSKWQSLSNDRLQTETRRACAAWSQGGTSHWIHFRVCVVSSHFCYTRHHFCHLTSQFSISHHTVSLVGQRTLRRESETVRHHHRHRHAFMPGRRTATPPSPRVRCR